MGWAAWQVNQQAGWYRAPFGDVPATANAVPQLAGRLVALRIDEITIESTSDERSSRSAIRRCCTIGAVAESGSCSISCQVRPSCRHIPVSGERATTHLGQECQEAAQRAGKIGRRSQNRSACRRLPMITKVSKCGPSDLGHRGGVGRRGQK
jgi:hypothetical protein